jgi:two-component sensor histidine kinase
VSYQKRNIRHERCLRAVKKLRKQRDEAAAQIRDNTHLIYRELETVAALINMVLNADTYEISVADLRMMRQDIGILIDVHAMLLEAQNAGDISHKIPLRPLLVKLLNLWNAVHPQRSLERRIADVQVHVRQFVALCGPLHAIVENAYVHGKGRVRVEVTHVDGSVTITVSDEGPGFPPDFKARTGSGAVGSENARGLGTVSQTQWSFSPIQGEVHYTNLPEGGAQVMLRFAVR